MNNKKYILIIIMLNINLFSSDSLNVNLKYNKNPLIAMGLSAVIPGTGQIYNGDWKRGLVYLTVEVLSFKMRNKYYTDAESYVDEYELYARENWFIDKWLEDFFTFSNPDTEVNPVYDAMVNNNNYFPPPWEYAHGPDFYNNGIFYDTSGNDFISQYINHACPEIIDQNGEISQSYRDDGYLPCDLQSLNFASVIDDHHLHEGIGKYNEFYAGWIDTEDGYLLHRNNTDNAMTPKKEVYQSIRNKSNNEYDKAEAFLAVIFLNHAASMFDAFFSGIIKTKNIQLHSNVNYDSNLRPTIQGLSLNIIW